MADKTRKISTLWYALLGLIKMHPNTGYGLRKIFQDTPMARYSSSPGAIYPALQNLESLKLIRGHSEIGKTGREKQTFRCTAAGTKKLSGWLRQPVTVEQIRQELDVVLLRFSYLDLLVDLDWSVEFLRQFIQASNECRKEVENSKASLEAYQPLHGQLALTNGIELLNAHVNWAKSALAIVNRKKKASS
jgi:DNA-binding PadR family transcriptional regulator